MVSDGRMFQICCTGKAFELKVNEKVYASYVNGMMYGSKTVRQGKCKVSVR